MAINSYSKLLLNKVVVYCLVLFCGSLILHNGALAQNTPDQLRESYLKPPKAVLDEVLSPRYKNVFLSNLDPQRKYFVTFVKDRNLTPIAEFPKHLYNLAGLEINLDANRKAILTNFKESVNVGLLLTNANTGKTSKLETPDNAYLSEIKWAPDGSQVAYFANFKDGTYIYVADIKSGKSKRLTKDPILSTLNTKFEWSSDGKYIFTVLVPSDRGDRPVKEEYKMPQIRMTTDKKNRLRTYPSLLQNPYEVALLKYYIRGQYARINVKNGRSQLIGDPAMIRNISISPDGENSLVTVLDSTFFYTLPLFRFGWRQEVWNLKGEKQMTAQKRKPRKGIPFQTTYGFKRRKQIKWRPNGEGLAMVLNPKKKKDSIYKIVYRKAPFGLKNQKTILTSKYKITGFYFGEKSNMLFVKESVFGKTRLSFVDLNQPDKKHTIYEYKAGNPNKNPGIMRFKTNENGYRVVITTSDEKNIFLSGTRYSKKPLSQSPRPFLNKVDIYTGEKKEVFKSEKDSFEKMIDMLDDDAGNIVIKKETAEQFPNYWSVETGSDKRVQLTKNKDYNKAITHAIHKRFRVERPDGLKFWVSVFLPENWNGKPLPGLIWHYPREYKNQKDYNKSVRKYNINKFSTVNAGWPEREEKILVKEGYAVIIADWPIKSDRGEPNDAFIYSIQQNSTAVIDSIVSKGYVDRERVAIGGHSYGGFGTINALIHTSLFKAGIAGSANSNRLLTPLGFQHEKRDLWRGRSQYLDMSPILYADRLDGALLMYSGADDQNVGTSPFMSWQMFHALNALGKTAALYMYPYAKHHTNAEEVNLDRWARWIDWLDHYVKNGGKPVPEAELGSSN